MFKQILESVNIKKALTDQADKTSRMGEALNNTGFVAILTNDFTDIKNLDEFKKALKLLRQTDDLQNLAFRNLWQMVLFLQKSIVGINTEAAHRLLVISYEYLKDLNSCREIIWLLCVKIAPSGIKLAIWMTVI